MVTGPIPQVNQTLNPTAPPPVAPTPPAPAAPVTPIQTGFPQQAPDGQSGTGLTETNGTDTVLLSDNAIEAQAAPPPQGIAQPNSLNPGAPGTPPFPGVIPQAAQAANQDQTGFIQPEEQTFIQAAPPNPIEDLSAGRTLDVTA